MKNFIQYINEHYVNLFYDKTDDIDMMKQLSHQAWLIIKKSYAYCGGLAGCKTYDDFVKLYIDDAQQDKLFWKLVRRDGDISALKIYTLKRHGRKGVVCAAADNEQGKKDLAKILHDDYHIEQRECWDELSGKALSSALHQDPIILPSNAILALMPDKTDIELLEDGYFYKRKIGGEYHIKCLFGYPKNKDEMTARSTIEFRQHIKELAIKYSALEDELNGKS